MDRLVTWLRGRPVWAQDAVLAVALTVVTQVELTLGEVEGPLWAQRLAFLVMTGALAGRRLAPLPAAVLGAAGMAAQTPLGPAPAVGGFLALMVLTHSVALRSSRAAAVVGLAAVLVGVHLYDVLFPEETSVGDVVGNAAIFVTIWGLGRGARRWRHRTERLRDRADALERTREAQTRAAVAGERARIARELHDIVAHGISVMVLQAGAARQVLDQDAERARDPLLTVESTGRQALDEMHRLLEVLRRDDAEASDPGAGLGQLGALAARMADTGLQVELSVRGEPRDLAPSLDLSAYRIVQEALTNALKHSGSGRARVEVRWTEDALELAVRDADGRTASPAGRIADRRPAEEGGHGLVGMRERVALFGGDLAAGPDPDGGWTVRARLPVAGARA